MDWKGKQPAGTATEGAARGNGKGSGAWTRPGPWVTQWPTAAEVERLSRCFPEVLVLPEEPIEAARLEWEGQAAVVRSFSHRVPAEWVAKDVAAQSKMKEVVAVPLAGGYLALRFRSTEDQDRALSEGPWVVAGQLLAMTPWVPDFEPGEEAVQTAMVWLRLPRLPPEYWSTSTTLHIAARAGQPVTVDGVTKQRQAMGFARVKVAVDTTKPLLPGVLIQGKTKVRWQPFVFENAPALCSRCGQMGHQAAACRFPATTSAEGGSASASASVEVNPGGGPA
ncbi:uncharacterized protein LOC120104882 [Phoenix dactylifera]|uniref:Uncharacterized protein LOC120104882 n=1 Tax=Phoenix dactylifera TaxID=42345 RepID=A0A8B8ZM60_PHODC|nr:uncharacterized protein LOC120104882 [Phoenix dactylifera]